MSRVSRLAAQPERKLGAAENPFFLPWSLPAALFLGLGIVAAHAALPLWLLALASFIAFVLGLFRAPVAVLLTLLLLPLGYVRYDLWQAQDNPLTPFFGQTLTLSGRSDGQYLTLDELQLKSPQAPTEQQALRSEPEGVRVVLSPQGEVAPGRVTLEGDLVLPSGKRNPGGFDYAAYLRRRGVWGQVLVDEVTSLESARLGPKARLQRGVTAGLGERQAALLQAMTLGIRDDLGELRELFAASGLAHILALSGLHVGILVAALALLLTPLGTRRYPLLILLVVGFVLLVGPSPSVVRAGTMTAAVLLSLWWGAGRLEPWPALALSALLSLLWNPSWLFDISFQLSYLAVTGILLFTEPVTRLLLGKPEAPLPWWHWRTFVVGSMVVSLSAQLLTLPLVASSFGSLPLFSPFVNVLGIPLASVLVPLGFLAGLLGLIALPLAVVLNQLTGIVASALIWLADLGSSLPSLIWGEVAWLGYALFYLAVAALAAWALGWLKPWRMLLVVVVATLCSMASRPPNPAPEVVFLDVGQGDSTLIRLPGRREILVDGGGSPFSDFDVGAGIVLPALKALGIDELELVVATHADTDHIEGLVSVLDSMPVGQLVIGVRKDGDPLFDALMAAAARNEVPVLEVVRGESVQLGDARLDILNPSRFPAETDNDNSVAFVLNYQGVPKALLTGDVSVGVERRLAFPDLDIVLAGHHGSSSSTSAELLQATSPEHVVLSYGRNSYGHPSPEVLRRIEASGTELHETFREGAIRLPLD